MLTISSFQLTSALFFQKDRFNESRKNLPVFSVAKTWQGGHSGRPNNALFGKINKLLGVIQIISRFPEISVET